MKWAVFDRLAIQPTSRRAVLCGKNFNIGCYMETFQPDCFVPAMLVGTINL